MKHVIVLILLLLSIFVSCFMLSACGVQSPDATIIPSETDMNTKKPVSQISFEEIKATENLAQFISDVDYPDKTHNNEAQETGAIISPYFTMTVNGVSVDCYSVRTANGAHSFAMIDADDECFPLSVELTLSSKYKNVTVLPEKYGVKATVADKNVSAEIDTYGNYTFVPENKNYVALTLFVREKEAFTANEGYEVIRVSPGEHDESVKFTGEKQVLYFESGTHFLKHSVELLNNTEVYLEPGAYLYAVMPDSNEAPTLDTDWAGMKRWNALFWGVNVSDVCIGGRGFIDLSRLDWHARSGIQFDMCNNVRVEGITLNNSPEWTMFFTRCTNVTVSDVLLFGYRQNSDGIAIVDTAHALIKNCFARSGDDLFEVKSMYGGCSVPTQDIVFDNCNAWPDKCRGLGIIAESVNDMSDIHFIDCSVGFAPAEWMDELGALVVYIAGNAHIKDVTFENTEIHDCRKYPINVTLGEASGAVIDDLHFNNIIMNGDTCVNVANKSNAGVEILNVYFENCVRNGSIAENASQLKLKLTNTAEENIHIIFD